MYVLRKGVLFVLSWEYVLRKGVLFVLSWEYVLRKGVLFVLSWARWRQVRRMEYLFRSSNVW